MIVDRFPILWTYLLPMVITVGRHVALFMRHAGEERWESTYLRLILHQHLDNYNSNLDLILRCSPSR